jgi:hypothetical protein
MTKSQIVMSLMIACIGVGLWLYGRKSPAHVPDDLAFKYLAELIRPPRFFYVLCGLPKSPNHPEGIMSAWAFAIQLMGFGFFIRASLHLFLNYDLVGTIIGLLDLLVTIAVVYGFTYWLTKKRAHRGKRFTK